MTQPAKAPEPSMEEILASIRRIIADDETRARNAGHKPAPVASPPVTAARTAAAPTRVSSPPPRPLPMNQEDIDSMLSGLDVPPAKPAGMGDVEAPPDVLALTEAMTVPGASAPPPVFRAAEGQPDVFFTEETSEKSPPLESFHAPQERPSFPSTDGPLMAATTSAAVDAAFNALAQTVMVQNSRSLEDIVREMMRPMLKAWLDDNLPGLVERVVRAEIERVSRGRSA